MFAGISGALMATISGCKQILLFKLNDKDFGFDVSCVREILLPQEIYPVPKAPEFVEGVINVRGHMIAVVDLRKKLCLENVRSHPHMRIIICQVRRFIVGVLVDDVREVIHVSPGGIMPAPGILNIQMDNNAVWGIVRDEKEVVMLLDLEKIFTDEETQKFSQMKNA